MEQAAKTFVIMSILLLDALLGVALRRTSTLTETIVISLLVILELLLVIILLIWFNDEE